MDLNLTLSNRQIVPAVTNMFQFENQTTTLNFVLDSYMWEETDLRNYIPYAVTSINGVIDVTELTATYNENTDKLTVSWTVGEYTLSEKGAVLYQIVFKENKLDGEIGEEDVNNAVWYSYKAIMINRSSIDGDNHITANYPTLLKQWLDKMGAMEDELIKVKDKGIDDIEEATDEYIEEINELAAKFDTSVVYIPYGETIPVENRLSNRLYYQYTDETHTKGRFEDSNGVILNLDPTGYVTCIGQTIFSLLPINNAGLHLLDGTKLLGDGAYSAFVEYVAKLHDKSLNCFCTEDEWQQSVTNYGVCGKFVYNADENSVRLPKVTGFVEGTVDLNALGDLTQAGLPNITGKFESKGINSEFGTINYGEGAFDVKVAAGYDETANAGSSNIVNTDVAEFDASKSNAIYGNSDTVQPQAIKGYYYMVVGTNVIDEIVVDPYLDELEAKTEECIERLESNGVFGRNVGDIFYTSRLDTELNGAVECNGGFYSTEDFAGSQSIDSLLKNNSLPYVSLTEYTSQITTNGYCRAFGWDGGTSFRVPTIPALLLTKEEAAVVGNGYALGVQFQGLNDETEYNQLTIGNVGSGGGRTLQWRKNASPTLAGSAFKDGEHIQHSSSNLAVGVSKNPEYSGLLSNLPVIEYRAMVQLANGATDEALITATSALQQIGNKVDRSEADYVVEEYKDGDDWYRVYKSGWVEQGGRVVPSTSWKGVVLLKPMADSYYSVMVTNCGEDVTRYAVKAGTPSKNTATTVYMTAGNDSTGVYWQVKGQGA